MGTVPPSQMLGALGCQGAAPSPAYALAESGTTQGGSGDENPPVLVETKLEGQLAVALRWPC